MINTAEAATTQKNGRGVDIEATDFSGQRRFCVVGYPTDAKVGDLVRDLVARMGLRRADPQGRPYTYHPLLERESRHLLESEIVGDVFLESGDVVRLTPNINAA